MFKFDLDWSDGGATPSVYLLLIGPKGMGGGLLGTAYLLLPCFKELYGVETI